SAASGRALLAMVPIPERTKVIRQLKMKAYSPRTVTEASELDEVIKEGEARGYHLAVGEYQSDTTAIAVGFRFGTESYALLVGGPTRRLEGRIEEGGRQLMEHAKAIQTLV